MASAVDSRLAYARLSAVATASRLPTATRGSNNSYTTSWDTTASYVICVWGQFDVLSVVFAKTGGYSGALSFGTFATAAVIAGGSKGAILLFQGVLGFGREAVNARIAAKATKPAKPGE